MFVKNGIRLALDICHCNLKFPLTFPERTILRVFVLFKHIDVPEAYVFPGFRSFQIHRRFRSVRNTGFLYDSTTVILGLGITVVIGRAVKQLSSAGERKAPAPSLPQSPAGR